MLYCYIRNIITYYFGFSTLLALIFILFSLFISLTLFVLYIPLLKNNFYLELTQMRINYKNYFLAILKGYVMQKLIHYRLSLES